LFLLKSTPRLLPEHRHSSHPVASTIPSLLKENQTLQNTISALTKEKETLNSDVSKLNSLNKDLKATNTNFQKTNDDLTSKKNKLLSETKNLQIKNQPSNAMPSPSEHPRIELFKHLRQLCNDQNPHKARLINLTASSIFLPSVDASNIFEYSRDNYWCSKTEPNQWLHFDLKRLSFKIEKIRFDVYFRSIPRSWRLLGSNDNQTWKTIHDQGNDKRCISDKDFVVDYVDYDVQSSDFFTFIKFEQLDNNYSGFNPCALYSVEFIGQLNSQQF
jgi:hypothetical protein